MFWRFGGYANTSTIDTLLDKSDVTLEELLDESDLIQELKQHNTKLIEYLRDENVLRRLLDYVIAPGSPPDDEPSDDEEESEVTKQDDPTKGKEKPSKEQNVDEEEQEKAEKIRLKYSYVACEVLSSETWSILESLMQNEAHLKEFWEFMRRAPPLDPLQAGYFTKVNETLLEKKTEEMLAFFKCLEGIVPAMLQHVDCPMVMDLLLKIISLEKADGGQGIVDWLQSQDLIPSLLAYLSPEHPSSTQTSAGDFLKAIITISANASQNEQSCIGPNSLTRQLVSVPCMESLISSMLRGGNPLTVGVGIVIEVIRKNNSDYDPDNGHNPDAPPTTNDPIYLGTLLRMFARHVPDFMDLILSSKHTVTEGDTTRIVERGQLNSAWGTQIEPLGFDRFKTCELMAELLHCSNMGLLNERGSEDFIRQRDAERERLRAAGAFVPRPSDDSAAFDTEGQTTFRPATPPSQSPPSLVGGSPDETRKLEIANASEDDGFEDVAASGVLSDEVKDDFDEKDAAERGNDALSDALYQLKGRPKLDLSDEFVDEPLSSPKLDEKVERQAHDDKNRPPDPSSPTSSGLTDEVRRVSIEDTTMSFPPEDANEGQPTPSSHEPLADTSASNGQDSSASHATPAGLSPHPEDTPAPLFASHSGSQQSDSQVTQAPPQPEIRVDSVEPIDSSGVDAADMSQSIIMGGNEQLFEPHIEMDTDGQPVVGDYLKTMFVENKVVPTILSFFFRFPWNNFLHNVVYDVVQQVFNGPMDRGYNRSLAIDLFETGAITEQIVEGQRRSDEAQAKNNMRLGYMGHLTLVAEEVVKFSERHPAELLSQSVMDKVLNRQWIDYVEQTLSETRERDNAILGGVRPDMSVGPRQAVLNAVNAAQGFGNSSALASAGLNGGGAQGLDSIDLSNNGSASSGAFGLLSGFGSSSDDEDEEMEEAEEDETLRATNAMIEGSSDNANDNSTPPLIPPPPAPLNIPPSRARRQLAARLALHKQQAAEAAAAASGDTPSGESSDDPAIFTPNSDSDPFAIDEDISTARASRSPTKVSPLAINASQGISSLFNSSGGRKHIISHLDDDDDEEDDEDEAESSSSPTNSSDEDTHNYAAEARRRKERQPLEIDDEEGDDEEMGEMVVPSAEGPNSSDEDEPMLDEDEKKKLREGGSADHHHHASSEINHQLASDSDDEEAEGLVEIKVSPRG